MKTGPCDKEVLLLVSIPRLQKSGHRYRRKVVDERDWITGNAPCLIGQESPAICSTGHTKSTAAIWYRGNEGKKSWYEVRGLARALQPLGNDTSANTALRMRKGSRSPKDCGLGCATRYLLPEVEGGKHLGIRDEALQASWL